MTVFDLMNRLGGEILSNKVRVTVDGVVVIVARLNDQDWVLTEKGQELLNLHSNLAVAEAAEAQASTAKTRKKTASAVEFRHAQSDD